MKPSHRQRGATLVVSLIMLMVLTVLAVFAIRSGNTNLRIAGNMQYQAEAHAAAQQAIEQVVEQIKSTDNIAQIAAQTVTVSTAGASYSVSVPAMSNQCILSVPVLNQDLDPSVADDVPCFESVDEDRAIQSTGSLVSRLSACKNQTWEIQAQVNDSTTGTSVTQVQGLSIRVPATVTCSGS